MSSAVQITQHNFEELQEVILAEEDTYFRSQDPEFPRLAYEQLHSSLDSGEVSYQFTADEDGDISFAIAVTGLAESNVPFRITSDNEDCASRIDIEKSFITMTAAQLVGWYSLAEQIELQWNTTTDQDAILQIVTKAREHAATLKRIGALEVSGERGLDGITDSQFSVVV